MERTLQLPQGGVIWSLSEKPGSFIVVDPDDARLTYVQDGAGIGRSNLLALGTADQTETEGRHALSARLLTDYRLRRALVACEVPSDHLTESGSAFMADNTPDRPHNSYWAGLHRFMAVLRRQTELPPRMQRLLAVYDANAWLEEVERSTAAAITLRLKQVVVFEGEARVVLKRRGSGFSVEIDKEKSRAFGRYLYAEPLAGGNPYEAPNWIPQDLKTVRGVLCWPLARFVVWRQCRAAYRRVVFGCDAIPGQLWNDLAAAVQEHGDGFYWPSSDSNVIEADVQFSYAGGQIVIHVLRAAFDLDGPSLDNVSRVARNLELVTDDLERYSPGLRRHFWAMRCEVGRSVLRHEDEGNERRLWMALLACRPDFFVQACYEAPETAADYTSCRLLNVLSEPEIQPVVRLMRQHRDFFVREMLRLQELAQVIERMRKRAKALRLPLTMPGWSETEAFACGAVAPIHLKGERDALQARRSRGQAPIPEVWPKAVTGMVALNGRPVFLQGDNGSGKSALEMAAIGAIYLAKMGLPVFGQGVLVGRRLRLLGSVFLERGLSGSTADLILQKMVANADAIKQHQIGRGEACLVLDEVGGGTDPDHALEQMGAVIRVMLSVGVSLLGSSQLPKIGDLITSIGGVCLHLDERYRVQPGAQPATMVNLESYHRLQESLAELTRS